jgi:hypothetical protein
VVAAQQLVEGVAPARSGSGDQGGVVVLPRGAAVPPSAGRCGERRRCRVGGGSPARRSSRAGRSVEHPHLLHLHLEATPAPVPRSVNHTSTLPPVDRELEGGGAARQR